MKKLLILGGSSYLLPAIRAAHELGIYVITADYLPDNIAHKYSDEYHNVSIIDKDAILQLAEDLQIDGIVSYATDPGVVVAAYVAEKLGLPTSPYESVKILQNKGKFRGFLRDNNFNVPYSETFKEYSEVELSKFKFPIIVKPVDSAGSKGVTRVDDETALRAAFEYALKYSITGEVIIEEFIEKKGYSTDTDSFSIDGKLVLATFNDQCFDETANNPYTPAGYIYPCSMPVACQKELRQELQRLMNLLNMGTTIYNIETRVGKDGKCYIMECTPRAGGNRLAEMVKLSSGYDIIKAEIKAVMGMPIEEELKDPVYDGVWGELILHSNKSGKFKSLHIDSKIPGKNIIEVNLWINPGDEVHEFTGANETIGTVILRCDTREEMDSYFAKIDEYVTIDVE